MSPVAHNAHTPCRCNHPACEDARTAHIRAQVTQAGLEVGQQVLDEFGRAATITEILDLDYPGPPIRARMALGINGSEAVGLFYPDRLRPAAAEGGAA